MAEPNPDEEQQAEDEPQEDVELSKEKIAEIKKVFEANDGDKDGRIELEEMATAMRTMQQSPTEQQLKEMFLEMDTENVGSIDFEDFVSIMQRYSKDYNDNEKDLLDAFQVMDKMGRGFLNAAQFREMMVTMGDTLTESEADELLKELTIDKEGQISYEEFIGLVMRI
ncbi:uncharacterized protein LOC141905559 [Tubulanus polymorphus]|uniref:uncharacterized protein LOC141905559 n=1 Tax=Tubulanus polymorphus TaxID=672921 RepID=UPI003DA5C89E